MSFLVVASVCFFFVWVFEGGRLGFSRDFPQPPDCVGFSRGAQLIDIVFPTFLLGFLNEFSCFCLEFKVVEIRSGGLLIECTQGSLT